MPAPFVFFKDPAVDSTQQADISSLLQPGETVAAITLGAVNPVSTPSLTAVLNSGTATLVQLSLSGGLDSISYGFTLTVQTNARVFLVQFAVVAASSSDFIPYTTQNPDAFQDLIDEIEAGKAAVGTSIFSFPPSIDPKGGSVTWELLDSDGTVYAAGNAYNYSIYQNGISNTVKANAIIAVPSNVPACLNDQRYQLRYTLSLPQSIGTPDDPLNGTLGQNVFFQFENVRVVGLNTVPLGTQPSVELQGVNAPVSIVIDRVYDVVTVEMWAGGQQIIAPVQISDYERTSDGYYYSGVINTANLQVSLVPYQVIWKYYYNARAFEVNQEYADFWVINPSIASAINDVRARINKAHTTLYGTPDLLFTDPTVLTWLRRGGDQFNGAYGQFTSFTFTNALGPIREYWLMCSEKSALEAQLIAEGEKAFNFQGAAISLDVDRTQAWDNAIGKIQQQLDNELKSVKVNLIIKGNTSGDGSANVTALQAGALGSVGVTITAASAWTRGFYNNGWGNRLP
jgi:hypothetical protein